MPGPVPVLLVILVGLLVLSLVDLGRAQDMPPAQRAALVDLYNSTNGLGWGSSTGWLNGDPCSQAWYGLACEETDDGSYVS